MSASACNRLSSSVRLLCWLVLKYVLHGIQRKHATFGYGPLQHLLLLCNSVLASSGQLLLVEEPLQKSLLRFCQSKHLWTVMNAMDNDCLVGAYNQQVLLSDRCGMYG